MVFSKELGNQKCFFVATFRRFYGENTGCFQVEDSTYIGTGVPERNLNFNF